MSLEEIYRILANVECPFCCSTGFDIGLRCGPGYKPCLQVAQCRQCGHTFDARELLNLQGQSHLLDSQDQRPSAA